MISVIESTKNQFFYIHVKQCSEREHLQNILPFHVNTEPLHHCKAAAFRTLSAYPAKIQEDFGLRVILRIVLSPKMSVEHVILCWSTLFYISRASVCYDILKISESLFHPSFFKRNIWPFSLNDEFLQKLALAHFPRFDFDFCWSL